MRVFAQDSGEPLMKISFVAKLQIPDRKSFMMKPLNAWFLKGKLGNTPTSD